MLNTVLSSKKISLEKNEQLFNIIPRCSVRNEQVSKWSVGMHMEHCLLGTTRICSALIHSKPYTGKIKKGFWRRIILLTGIIPRGHGKSPTAAIPKEQTTESGLRELLAEANLATQKAAASDCDCWWKHPFFGVMKRDEALKFVEIHNKHHLKIISDILSHN